MRSGCTPRSGHFYAVQDVTGITERWWLPAEYELKGVLGRGSFGVVVEVAAAGVKRSWESDDGSSDEGTAEVVAAAATAAAAAEACEGGEPQDMSQDMSQDGSAPTKRRRTAGACESYLRFGL